MTSEASELRGERVVLCPLSAADAPTLRAIRLTPEVAAWWGPLEDDFPFTDDPDATRFTILRHDAVAGLIQFGEEPEPMYRHAWIDLFVDPGHGRQGLGTDAIVTLVRHLTEDRGHHRITIDPALDNVAAIGCYEKAGFRRVGVMHAAERDPLSGCWRDALMMELVVPPPAT
ncbi:MAG: GNAT family N-acetyltransferase [Actinomycetota bacterium]|nr:GNAT family N-acetyltransferase [Actinomycetota bacterium]MDQ3677061.1 GNAT family N-acetyltransferase [Actinomycetota bacterium]